MSLLQSIALSVPKIRRLRDARNALLVECEALRAQLAAVPPPAPEDPAAAEMRLARAEGRLIVTEYAYHPRSRPIENSPGGTRLSARLRAEEDRFAATLRGIARHADTILQIPRTEEEPERPFWTNDWFPPFDGVSLYGLLAEHAPRRYIEVGSGNSTRFARQAIRDLGLRTRIVSIDPRPHTTVDAICDEITRSRMEGLPRDFWEGIGEGDIFFVDNSHRSFQNSDVTVFFTEVLPALGPGAIWGLHDIFLPWDYPDTWRGRFYNEQYLLMAYLLGGAGDDEILLPVRWATHQPSLRGILAKFEDLFQGIGTGGCWWMRRRGVGV